MRSTSSFIEVREFSKAEGTEFLLSLLSGRQAGDESEAASELCGLLGGHALAIDQMASLIHKRSWGFREFLQIYRSHKDVILGSKDGSGSYEHKIGNVWDMTFNELDQPAAALLGVMSFVDPDSIPGALFEPRDLDLLPPSLDFCVDQWRYDVCFVHNVWNVLTVNQYDRGSGKALYAITYQKSLGRHLFHTSPRSGPFSTIHAQSTGSF